MLYIHPTDPGDDYDFDLGIPNALIEVTFDTTRAVTNMMYNGILDKYPDIRYILLPGDWLQLNMDRTANVPRL